MGDVVFVQALALGLDPAWRRLPEERQLEDGAAFVGLLEAPATEVETVLYSTVGIEPGIDVLVWRRAVSVAELEEANARLLRTGLGRSLSVRHAFLGKTGPSQYARRPSSEASSAFESPTARYLVIYPFTKSTEWYLLGREARQGIMNEHMRIGHEYPAVRQLLTYSFGLDDQDFVVMYETDDLSAFGELVRALRATEGRRSTVNDQPIVVGVRRSAAEFVRLLIAS